MIWWRLPAWGAAIYLALCALVWLFQSKLIWMPMGEPGPAPRRVEGAPLRECWLRTEDGLRLHAWWIRRPDPVGVALVCHGNAGNLEHRLSLAIGLLSAGFDVLLFDYRGFGRSEGSPNEEGTYRDAVAAWDFLVQQEGVEPSRLLAYGESLGGAVALELTRRRRCAALFVESTFTSLPAMAAAAYPFLPARWLCRPRYANLEKIPDLELPLLIAHGSGDEIVPFSHGRALFEAAPEPKRFHEKPGGHNAPGLLGQPGGIERVRDWWQEVVPSG